jgi:hypothetical protein
MDTIAIRAGAVRDRIRPPKVDAEDSLEAMARLEAIMGDPMPGLDRDIRDLILREWAVIDYVEGRRAAGLEP